MAIYILGLSIRAFEVTVITIAKFLITCFVSEILKDKDTGSPLTWIFKNPRRNNSQTGKFLFVKKQ